MIPQEVKDLIGKLVKESVDSEVKDIKDELKVISDRLDLSQTDIEILKEGDNI